MAWLVEAFRLSRSRLTADNRHGPHLPENMNKLRRDGVPDEVSNGSVVASSDPFTATAY